MKRILLLVFSGFLLTTTIKAQDKYTASGGLLGAANFSEFRSDNGIEYKTKTSWAAGLWFNLPVGRAISIEPQLAYNSYQYFTNNPTTLLINDGKVRYISVPVLLKFHASNMFAIAVGPQFDFVTAVKDKRHIAVQDDFKSTSFSLTGGIELFPHGRATIFGRYILGLTNMDANGTHSTAMEFKNGDVQVGLKLRLFGGKKSAPPKVTDVPAPVVIPDRDGDGINDQLDKCPDTPGLAKYDGCPIPDSDGDGINDEEDKCPTVAGLAKYNGCPIPDSDGDGINDEEDKCPTVAGVAKYNGCPVPDRDNDGINDDEDKCPDIAGTAANNGCPDVPANVSKSLGVAAQNISFGSTNAKLTTRSNASLDNIVTIMNENPGLRIKIEGHTDNVGDDDANMKLSEDRAASVKTYLVSKGISENRITSEGFGETMPISDNNTSSGRAKNRRIEVRVSY